MNYYNDNDPKSAAWLRELIKQNVIPVGKVDERSIKDVTGSDLKQYRQCHFFAGIGGGIIHVDIYNCRNAYGYRDDYRYGYML